MPCFSDNLVSVVMPCYRVKPSYFEKSIESILSQNYDNLELIVIMDPSHSKIDKEMLNLLDSFSDDKRLRVILHKKRKGLARSLNEGILTSKGKYIARADGDDINRLDRIARQIRYMIEKGYHMVGSWALIIDEKNEIISYIRKPVTPREIRSRIMLHSPFIHPSVVIQKDVFKDVGLYNPQFEYSEDYELWLRIVSKGYRCANYPDYLVMLRHTKLSITRGSSWFKNRSAYFRSKLYAFRNYGFNNIIDFLFLAATLFALISHPSIDFIVKGVLRHFNL